MMTISFDRVHAVKQKSDYTKDINLWLSPDLEKTVLLLRLNHNLLAYCNVADSLSCLKYCVLGQNFLLKLSIN
jgi:hypothetical protein